MAANWARQAALESLLKFKPQNAALGELRKAAEEQFAGQVQAGRSEGTLGVQAANAAVAPTRQVFSQARSEGERGRNLIAPTLAALGASNPFSIAAGNEAAAGGERRANSEASALSALQQRKVAAQELPAFTRSAAMATLLKELSKIQGKKGALEGEEAANTQTQANKLRHEAASEAGAERRSERSSSTSRANAEESNRTRQQLAKEKGEAGAGIKLQSQSAQAKAAEEISSIKGVAARYFQHGLSRAQVAERVEKGIPSQSGKSEKGNPYKTPAVPAYSGGPLMEAALDELQYGHVTKPTLKRLHAVGYSVNAIGLNGPPKGVSPGSEKLGNAAKEALKPLAK